MVGIIVFLLIGSGELQPWAINHTESSVLCDNLLLSKF